MKTRKKIKQNNYIYTIIQDANIAMIYRYIYNNNKVKIKQTVVIDFDIWFHLGRRAKCFLLFYRSPSLYQFLRVEYNLPAPGVMIDELHNHTTM